MPADRDLTLVLVAHPDDEVLGMAGVIARAVREGLSPTVAIATNGNAWGSREDGLRRDAESVAGLALLGVPREQVVFLGYPDGWLGRLPRFRAGQTYALGGEYRFLRTGRHARRTRRNFARDVRDLVAGASVVYTHVPFDGHGDHVAVAKQVIDAAGSRTEVYGTLMHPPGAGECLELSASRWPGPAGDPAARFRPAEELEPPPSPACAEHPPGRSWGPFGPPHVLLEVPDDMRVADEAVNLKWRAIACHESQVGLGPVSAGYMRGFVRQHEVFWRLLT
ncbi:MAG TPA: PIG-L family deacetylase [Gaiellaceae bacterium]|nr:PIG-L family deacetylase [Gaiellaceae bacterium]